MKNKTPIILVNSLNIDRGGVTKSALTYANLLIKQYKVVYIGTFLYQRNYKKIIDTLYNEGYLNKRVKVLNMFEDAKPFKNKKYVSHKIKEKGFVEFKDKKQKKQSFRYYKDGLYLKYKRFTEDGELMFIDYMDNSRQRTMREEYNHSGLVSRRRHMNKKINRPSLDQYFDDKMKCYLTTWVNPKTLEEKKYLYFNEQNLEFDSLNDLRAMWLNNMLKNIDKPVLMIDKREIDNLMKDLKHNNLKTIAILHSNHFRKPYERGSELKANYKFLFNNAALFDKIVCLTESQKRDIEEQYGFNNKIEVIPHTVERIDDRIEPEVNETKTKTAVSIARYDKEKRLDDAIRMFKIVVDKIPFARYDIYGTGSQKEELQQLINKLNLQDNVKLKGYTNEPYNRLREADCSILTSDFEGFGRVVSESLYVGTPVVSYDINYGPRDIIRNNVDGYIVEKGNKKEMAEKIIDIFQDENLKAKLSARAVEIEKRLRFKRFKNSWLELLRNI